MRYHIERLRRAVWLYKQPLTHVPGASGIPVSDLFVWRNSDDWKTCFELTDVAGLFDAETGFENHSCIVCLFDAVGRPIGERRFDLVSGRRRTIDVSDLLPAGAGDFGTFSVFHSHTPALVTAVGSFLAERGYVSYCYQNAPLRSYVHGNLDAVARHDDSGLRLLGAGGLLRREYRLQHLLTGPALYEVAIVNPSTRAQKFVCRTVEFGNGSVFNAQEVQLRPGASHIFPVWLRQELNAKVVIQSRLVMARPLVFHMRNRRMDVFHG